MAVVVKGRRKIAASILAVLLIGGYFASSGTGRAGTEFIIHATLLILTFWFPAIRIGEPRDLLVHGRSLVVWLLAWTLVWDLATAGILGTRTVLAEWWLVYPSGVITFGALLWLHAVLVRRTESRRSEPEG